LSGPVFAYNKGYYAIGRLNKGIKEGFWRAVTTSPLLRKSSTTEPLLRRWEFLTMTSFEKTIVIDGKGHLLGTISAFLFTSHYTNYPNVQVVLPPQSPNNSSTANTSS
jgi:hypothetical protein